jgi:hypothetical protein
MTGWSEVEKYSLRRSKSAFGSAPESAAQKPSDPYNYATAGWFVSAMERTNRLFYSAVPPATSNPTSPIRFKIRMVVKSR